MKVLVSDNLAETGVESLMEVPEFEVEVNTSLTHEELRHIIKEYDALIIRSGTKVTADIIENADNLKVIARAGIGLDNVDVEAASKRGIVVMNTPEGNVITTAEHTIAMLLAVSRNIPQATASLKEGKWEKKRFRGKEVFHKTLGIIGVGRIGRVVAERAVGLQMNVIAFDPYINAEVVEKLGITAVTLDELYARSDYITVHTPMTQETRGIINAQAFQKMKKGVYILNCARGGIVDEAALYDAIQSGIVAGAALDVFAKEPPVDNPLLSLSQVVATPHLGASTDEAQENVAIAVSEQVIDYLLRGTIRNAVNAPSIDGTVLASLRPYLILSEKLGSLLTHDGAFCSVPVSAAAENHNQFFLSEFFCGFENFLQTIRSVGIIHNDGKRLSCGNTFETPRNSTQCCHAPGDGIGRESGRYSTTDRTQNVPNVEITKEWGFDL